MNSRYKLGSGRLRIVWETEKPKNLYVRSMDMNWREENVGGRGVQGGGE